MQVMSQCPVQVMAWSENKLKFVVYNSILYVLNIGVTLLPDYPGIQKRA